MKLTKLTNCMRNLVFGSTALLLSCSVQPTPVSETKFDEVVTHFDAPRYEFFLTVLQACLADASQPLCKDNLKPSVILPLRLASAADSARLMAAFSSTPSVFACDPGQTNACALELPRSTRDAADLEVLTDRQEQLSKLTFKGDVLKIKMRLVIAQDNSKTIEICKIAGVEATKKVIFVGNVDANVIKAVFRYDSNNKLRDSNPIVVTVDAFGGSTTENCEF
jgi:hypothetical protein